MKKYLVRIISALLAVCFGVCVFAACDEDETPPIVPGTTGTGDGAGDSVATDPIEGVWSGASLEDGFFWLDGSDTFTATVDLFDNALHDGYIVVVATETNENVSADIYITMGVDKEGDTYTGTFIVDDPDTPYSFSAKLDGENLTATVTSSTIEPTTLTFTEKTEFPAAIAPAGVMYPSTGLLPYEMDFTNKALKANDVTIGARFYNIGEYVAVVGLVNNTEVADIGFTVFEKGGKYYAFSVIYALDYSEYFDETTGGMALVAEKPSLSVTVSFETTGLFAGVISTVTLTSMNEQFTLPDAPTMPEGYVFKGWYQSHWFHDYFVGNAGDTVTLYEDIPNPQARIRLYARFESPSERV